ncbi:MAG: hypothetical protein ABUL57_02380, partial [Chloroflexota bacterium]
DAVDPATGKSSETPRTVVITVPFLVIQAPTLVVNQPVEGTTYGNGAIAIDGTTTNAKTVTVVATFLGSDVTGAEATPAPTGTPPPAPRARRRPASRSRG